MVGLGFLLLLAGLWALWPGGGVVRCRGSRFWWLGVLCGPAAIVAMECGWLVTEVGRQPWVVYRLLTTAQAATTNAGVIASLSAVIVLYAALGVVTVLILRILADAGGGPPADEARFPYGPRAGAGADRRGSRVIVAVVAGSCCSCSRSMRPSAAPTSGAGSGTSSRAAPSVAGLPAR